MMTMIDRDAEDRRLIGQEALKRSINDSNQLIEARNDMTRTDVKTDSYTRNLMLQRAKRDSEMSVEKCRSMFRVVTENDERIKD